MRGLPHVVARGHQRTGKTRAIEAVHSVANTATSSNIAAHAINCAQPLVDATNLAVRETLAVQRQAPA
ncbi:MULTISPECIES: hypothetical protein [Tsukamurella]|uniref:hypothetical protein n=1 Tax=Tsukamurella TaxID=2060 RepID=UPI002DD44E2E|nr:hypothetical protein [Tsukamurella tyrosinosolvens]MEC4614938.1 hypothetical protein [Tsukamurella tyrosinosolvens]